MSTRPVPEPHPSFSEDDAEELYENAPCGYVSTLLDGTIVRANGTFLGWLELRAENLIGHTRFQDLLTSGGRIFYETHYAPLLRMQGDVREIAVEFSCHGGRIIPALINSTVKRDDSGNPVLIRTAVFHARDRREYERELLRARQDAEESESRARALARTLQATFVPPVPPSIPGLDVGASYRPAGNGEEVGGDFYDVFQTGRDRWAVVIGDVCGKGAEAAAITALARHTLRAGAIRARRPTTILHTLNEALLRHGSERFCTAVYAEVRGRTEGDFRITLAAGGHPLPLWVQGADVRSIGLPGTALGVLENPFLNAASVVVGSSDIIVFYTDGVTEARQGPNFLGEEHLRSLLRREHDVDAPTLARKIVREAIDFQPDQPRDDIAVVVLKVP